jgi:hypothetical protein
MSLHWHIASYRLDTEFSRYRGNADMVEPEPIKLDL